LFPGVARQNSDSNRQQLATTSTRYRHDGHMLTNPCIRYTCTCSSLLVCKTCLVNLSLDFVRDCEASQVPYDHFAVCTHLVATSLSYNCPHRHTKSHPFLSLRYCRSQLAICRGHTEGQASHTSKNFSPRACIACPRAMIAVMSSFRIRP
jgi:hypothetical protein